MDSVRLYADFFCTFNLLKSEHTKKSLANAKVSRDSVGILDVTH